VLYFFPCFAFRFHCERLMPLRVFPPSLWGPSQEANALQLRLAGSLQRHRALIVNLCAEPVSGVSRCAKRMPAAVIIKPHTLTICPHACVRTESFGLYILQFSVISVTSAMNISLVL
jgi:hypothetical protein